MYSVRRLQHPASREYIPPCHTHPSHRCPATEFEVEACVQALHEAFVHSTPSKLSEIGLAADFLTVLNSKNILSKPSTQMRNSWFSSYARS